MGEKSIPPVPDEPARGREAGLTGGRFAAVANSASMPPGRSPGRFLREALVPLREESLRHRLGVNLLALLEEFLPLGRWEPDQAQVRRTDAELLMDGRQVMQVWEEPVMRVLAEAAAGAGGDVLEIGFGLGISATHLVRYGCRSYTVIEANPVIVEQIERWRQGHRTPVTVIEGLWERSIDQLGQYDGIVFDPHPCCFRERTFAGRIRHLGVLARHLRPGGVLAPFARYHRQVPRSHLRSMRRIFSRVAVRRVEGLCPPASCDYYRESSMLCLICTK